MAERVLELVRQRGLASSQYEFQVLLGVQEQLWSQWRAAGHTVRVYVPFGPEWLPYSLRRLRKNPEMLRHLMRATLGLSKR
jgi:proline dehydrogenase